MFGQAKASFLVSNPREQRICTIGEAFRVLKSRIFRAKHWSHVAALGLSHANLLSHKLSGTFSALQFSGVVVGIGASDFTVSENNQVYFKSDFGEVGESVCSSDGTHEATAGKDVINRRLTDAT
jgi:hypothetical protein